MVLIFANTVTPRHEFIFRLFFSELIKTPWSVTCDKESYLLHEGPKLAYTDHSPGTGLFFGSSGILEEKTSGEKPVNAGYWEDRLFPTDKDPSELPQDPFGAAFYLVTRYEEYAPEGKTDSHGRFKAHESIAGRRDFIKRPVVNIWAGHIKKILLEKFPGIVFSENRFSFISTFDIDIAYAYRGRGFLRTLGGFARSLKEGKTGEAMERIKVLNGTPDPYDTFRQIKQVQEKYKFRQITFFLLGKYSTFDKNIDPRSGLLARLVKEVQSYSDIGIHPSYLSNSSFPQLRQEIAILEKITGKEIRKSRQHFLKLTFPQTYRNLIKAGITEDYTMGYASVAGFRAGICSPFYFYDLSEESETKLRIFPFQVMEGTLKDYMNLDPAEALEEIKEIINSVRAVNGIFISLWHNHSLSGYKEWQGWEGLYESMVRYTS